MSANQFKDITPSSPPEQRTEQEKEFYEYCQSFVEREGRWPKYREAKERFGWSSDMSVTQLLQQLYRKGWIERTGAGNWRFRQGKCPFCGQEIEGHGSAS